MVIPIHWGSTYFIFVVGFARVGEARIDGQYSNTWVPMEEHLQRERDGELERSDSDGQRR